MLRMKEFGSLAKRPTYWKSTNLASSHSSLLGSGHPPDRRVLASRSKWDNWSWSFANNFLALEPLLWAVSSQDIVDIPWYPSETSVPACWKPFHLGGALTLTELASTGSYVSENLAEKVKFNPLKAVRPLNTVSTLLKSCWSNGIVAC